MMKIAGAPYLNKAQIASAVMIAKGQTEGVNSTGGALVGDEIEDAIIVRRNLVGVARRNCRIATMGSDVTHVPRRTTDVVANFISDAAAITETTANHDSIALTARKIATLTRISSEIDEDSLPDAATDLVDATAYAIALLEDKTVFLGDSTSSFGGIRGIIPTLQDGNHASSLVNATGGHSTFAQLDTGDLSNLIGALPSWAMMRAKFYISPFGFATFLGRLGANAGNDLGPAGKPYLSYLGFEVVLCDFLPGSGTITSKVVCLFGAMDLATTLGNRRGLRIRRLEERFADSDQIGIQATERFDFVPHDLGGLIGLVGG
jgi:HK97 family phage major capsid protein